MASDPAEPDRLQALIDPSPLALVEFGLDTRIRLWNAAAERIFGCRSPPRRSGTRPAASSATSSPTPTAPVPVEIADVPDERLPAPVEVRGLADRVEALGGSLE